MKKIYLLLTALVLSFTFNTASAQGNIGLGLRFTPDGAGFSGKFFMDRNWAFEAQLNAGGIFGLEGESFNAVGLFEYHIMLPDPNWRIFLGAGFHFGAWDHRWYNENKRLWRDSEPIFGIDGVGGVEYKFSNMPLALSLDFKPAVNFVSDVAFFPHNIIGFGARFYIR
jgi:hypothetical protein